MDKNIFSLLPTPSELMGKPLISKQKSLPNINNHIHTPFSFSSFTKMAEIFQLARQEKIKVLGINDFYTAEGYTEFQKLAFKSGIFPVFNMEYIGLLKEEQVGGVRVNDPNNPGRTYLCGKAFKFPFELDAGLKSKLDQVTQESQLQINQMIRKTNEYFSLLEIPVSLSYEEIKKRFARNMVRERHLARAVRVAISENYSGIISRQNAFKTILKLQDGEQLLSDEAGLENQIRSKLLKKGGVAFVEETESSFLPVDELIKLIVNAGGIPCYPVLLDDLKGHFTEFETDFEQLHERLASLNIYAIELIPGRNDRKILTDFVKFFDEKGYIITFGTEHNTPDMHPLTVSCRNSVELGNFLQTVQYRGVCVFAAHQYLLAYGEKGYTNQVGTHRPSGKKDFELLGEKVLNEFFNIFS